MGLGGTSTERGCKRWVMTECPQSIYRAPTVGDALNDFGLDASQVVSTKDANVMFRGLQTSVRTLNDYQRAIEGILRSLLRESQLVCIFLDDPRKVPKSKGREQNARDARKVVDLRSLGLPAGDDFSEQDIRYAESCKELCETRATKYRFMDIVLCGIFKVLRQERDDLMRDRLARGAESSEEDPMPPVLLIEGIDPRGGDRLADSPRELTQLCTCDAMLRALDVGAPITGMLGEADLKLRRMEARVHRAISTGSVLVGARMILHNTTDTDVFATAVLHYADRLAGAESQGQDVYTYVAMKERGKYAHEALVSAMRKRQRIDDLAVHGDAPSGVLLVDVAALHDELQSYILADLKDDEECLKAWHAVTYLMVAVWALSGCDYVDSVGHFDVLMACFQQIVYDALKDEERWFCKVCRAVERLLLYDPKSDPHPVDSLQTTCYFLDRVVNLAVSHHTVRSKKAKEKLSGIKESVLRSAIWTMLYWSVRDCGHPPDLATWGFEWLGSSNASME